VQAAGKRWGEEKYRTLATAYANIVELPSSARARAFRVLLLNSGILAEFPTHQAVYNLTVILSRYIV
jgi:hypothetical protein